MPAPFCFAWVDPGETTFDVQHHVEDEVLESFEYEHKEGDTPSLKITFTNPRIGPLSAGRKRWAWLSWHNGTTYVPLFFGQVVGVPDSILGELITYVLVAKSLDYEQRKRALADDMRVAPHYDPVFLDLSKRDDPDAVLEGYSKLWHVDPVTLEFTASDIITGEDGTEFFGEADAPYDSVKVQVGQSPLMSVTIDASVNWTQSAGGMVDMGAKTFVSYSGDGFLSDWPKPGASVGTGWFCETGIASDVNRVSTAMTASWSYSWTNKAKKHRNGDTMSVSISETIPQIGTKITGIITAKIQAGVLDPFATDENGDPAPLNIPASVSITTMHVPLWQVNTSLILRYEASRTRSERLLFRLYAGVQPVLTSGNLDEHVTVPGSDVGVPIVSLLNWTSIRNTVVSVGQVIFPDYQDFPGEKIAQRCTTGGLTGSTLPIFSPLPGVTTADGAAVWTSLGATSPNDTPSDWKASTEIGLGTIILPIGMLGIVPYALFVQSGLLLFPQAGVSVSAGQVVRSRNGSYQVCKLAGTTSTRTGNSGEASSLIVWITRPWREVDTTVIEPAFSATWGVETVDGSAIWVSLGLNTSTGEHHYIATQGGTTGLYKPPFSTTAGATTSDGSVIWTNIGVAEIPVGGVPGHVSARSYFPSDRGLQIVEYLLCFGRSHLLHRSRVVQISFTCRFERAVGLTCRHNALLQDERLPGGQALGKIIACKLECGASGVMVGNITIACAVGSGGTVSVVPGTPVYVEAGVIDDVQLFEGETIVLPGVGDVGYTPPVQTTVDDGLVFPLTRNQILNREIVHGTLREQSDAIDSALKSAQQAAQLSEIQAPNVETSIAIQQRTALLNANSVSRALADNPIWYDIELKSVSGAAYNAEYYLGVTDLAIPKMIDLEDATA